MTSHNSHRASHGSATNDASSRTTIEISISAGGEPYCYEMDEPATFGVNEILIAVMGITGCGKSSFIRTAFSSANAEVSDWRDLVDIPTSTLRYNGHTIRLIDTPGFDDTNKSDAEIIQGISSWLAEFHIPTHIVAGIMYLCKNTNKRGNLAIISSEVGNPNNDHARTTLRSTPGECHQCLVPINSITENSCERFSCTMSCSRGTDSNYEGADHWDNQIRHIHKHLCHLEEDDMSSVSSNDQESLFDYPPSEGRTSTTVGSSSVQQELTYTNIEHMLAVLKTERGKCLEELRGLDVALKTIDQLANRKRPGSEDCLNIVGSGVSGTISP